MQMPNSRAKCFRSVTGVSCGISNGLGAHRRGTNLNTLPINQIKCVGLALSASMQALQSMAELFCTQKPPWRRHQLAGRHPLHDFRREFLKMAGLTVAGGATTILNPSQVRSQAAPAASVATSAKAVYFDVRAYGAKGDGTSIDTPAINAAIDAAANAGGGTVVFSAGVYASYSIHLKSTVALFLQQGATILAAPTPYEGLTSGGYDAAEPQGTWEPYQDY